MTNFPAAIADGLIIGCSEISSSAFTSRIATIISGLLSVRNGGVFTVCVVVDSVWTISGNIYENILGRR